MSPHPSSSRSSETGAAGSARPRRGRGIIASGAAAVVVSGVALAAGAQWTAHRVRASLEDAGLRVAEITVNPLSGAVTVDGLDARHDGVRVQVGSVETAAAPFALASPAEAATTVTLTDLVITTPTATVRIPRLEASGDNVDEARLRALFDRDSATPLAERFAALSAARVTMPEVTVEQKNGDVSSTFRLQQVSVTGLKDGVASQAASAAATFETRAGGQTVSGSTGESVTTDVHVAHLARVYTEAAASDADRTPRPVYGSFVARDIRVSARDGQFAIASVSGRDFRMGLTSQPLLALGAAIEKVKDPEALPPKERAAYFRHMAELVGALSLGEGALEGLSFDLAVPADADEDGGEKAEGAAGRRVRGAVARIAVTGGDSGALTATGVKTSTPDGGEVALASASLSGLGAPALARHLRAVAEAAERGAGADDAFSALAFSGRFSLGGLAVDIPGDRPSGRVKFTLKAYDGSYQDPVNGVPTRIDARLDSLVVDLPPEAPDGGDDADALNDAVRRLRAMGYDRVDFSARVEGSWEAATKTLRIGDVSFSVADMGGARLGGLLGDVSSELFSADADRAQAALMAARLKKLTLNVTDGGLGGRFAALQAKEQNGEPGAVRAGWATLAQLLLPSVLGASEGALELSRALGDFIRRSGSLSVTLTSKNPAGDPVGEIVGPALAGDPQALFRQLQVQAEAQAGPR